MCRRVLRHVLHFTPPYAMSADAHLSDTLASDATKGFKIMKTHPWPPGNVGQPATTASKPAAGQHRDPVFHVPPPPKDEPLDAQVVPAAALAKSAPVATHPSTTTEQHTPAPLVAAPSTHTTPAPQTHTAATSATATAAPDAHAPAATATAPLASKEDKARTASIVVHDNHPSRNAGVIKLYDDPHWHAAPQESYTLHSGSALVCELNMYNVMRCSVIEADRIAGASPQWPRAQAYSTWCRARFHPSQ